MKRFSCLSDKRCTDNGTDVAHDIVTFGCRSAERIIPAKVDASRSAKADRGGANGASDGDLNRAPKSKLSSSSSGSDELVPKDRRHSGRRGDEGSFKEVGKLSEDVSGNNPISLDTESPDSADNYLFQVLMIF